MALLTLYHGTSFEAAASILANGVSMDARRTRDPGDFGWGFYLTADPLRASCHGEVLLAVVVDANTLAWMKNPYFLENGQDIEPVGEVERLFHGLVFAKDRRMRTVRGSLNERIAVAQKVQDTFVMNGFFGIATLRQDGETVIFNPDAIREISIEAIDLHPETAALMAEDGIVPNGDDAAWLRAIATWLGYEDDLC